MKTITESTIMEFKDIINERLFGGLQAVIIKQYIYAACSPFTLNQTSRLTGLLFPVIIKQYIYAACICSMYATLGRQVRQRLFNRSYWQKESAGMQQHSSSAVIPFSEVRTALAVINSYLPD